MVFNATFNNISVILWRKQEYPEKTTDLPHMFGIKRWSVYPGIQVKSTKISYIGTLF
jgi:hypothetical protein